MDNYAIFHRLLFDKEMRKSHDSRGLRTQEKQLLSSLRKYHFLLGPLIFLGTLLMPTSLESQAQQFLAIFLLVVWLWIFTEVPLFISGILGVSLSTLFGLVSPKEALAPFADPIIFLFLSGFLFAKALEHTGLDEYLAHVVMGHKRVKRDPKLIVLAFFFLAFFCSMWISNTASVAMLLPLSFGVIKNLKQNFGIESEAFNEKLLLGLAYSATIGGNVTPIGSPPNLVAIGFLRNLQGYDISFLKWILMATPLSLFLFYVVYRRCISDLPETTKNESLKGHMEEVRDLNTKQRNVLWLFGITILIWILPSILSLLSEQGSSFSLFLKKNLSTAMVGVLFSSLLFLFPLNREEKILSSDDISGIDWGSLLLFGSGLSLGAILFKTGLAEVFAGQLSSLGTFLSPVVILLLFILVTIFFTEVASNTASANIIIPIMIAFAAKTSLDTTVTTFAMAIACNSAFMLPVATPPNVIVYGSHRVKKMSMIQFGWRLNFLAFAIISAYIVVLNLF